VDLQGQIRQRWVSLFLAVHGATPEWRLSSGSSNKTLCRCGGDRGCLPSSLASRGGGGRRAGGSLSSPFRCLLASQLLALAHGVGWRPAPSSSEAPWWGVLAAGDVGGSFMNKCEPASISGDPLLLYLLPAGQGGEGRRKRIGGAYGYDGGRGFDSTSASRRGAGRSPPWCLVKLPWGKSLELLGREILLSLERCRPQVVCCTPPLTSSAGVGGEGEGSGVAGLAFIWGWILGTVGDFALMVYRCIGLLAPPVPASTEDQQPPRVTATPDEKFADLRRCPSSAAPRKESSNYTEDLLRIAIKVVYAFLPLGCIRRRQLRSSPMSLPRFNGEDHSVLSSVKLTPYLQLNLRPRWSLPSRLLVEPLALRMERLLEAPEVHSCRFISSVFSTDPLAGSDCVLPR
jgi:hypothetical protein